MRTWSPEVEGTKEHMQWSPWCCLSIVFLLCLFIVQQDNKGFPCGSAGKESACNAGDLGSIPVLGRSPAEWKGYPLQYSGLENSMDCVVHGVTKSWTRLSDFHFNSPWYLYLKIRDERCGSVTGYGGCRSNLQTCSHHLPNTLPDRKTGITFWNFFSDLIFCV